MYTVLSLVRNLHLRPQLDVRSPPSPFSRSRSLSSLSLTHHLRALTLASSLTRVQTLKRREVRDAFSIKGDEVEDCILSSCCACCTLVQMEKEVSSRQSMGRPMEMNQQQQQGHQGYVPQNEGMEMPPPAP